MTQMILTFTPVEYQQQLTNFSHRVAIHLHSKGYITDEQLDELTKSLIVTYVTNENVLGRIKKRIFGDSNDKMMANVVISQMTDVEFNKEC